jgi:lactate permease
LVAGLGFAGVQFFWANYMDATLVDIMAGMATLALVAGFLKVWQPNPIWRYPEERSLTVAKRKQYRLGEVLHAWSPFIILAVFVIFWGLPGIKGFLASTSVKLQVPGLHNLVTRTPPVVANQMNEPAIMDVAWLASVGTATFIAGLIAGPLLGLSLGGTLKVFRRTAFRMRFSFLAIMAMICLGYITRYSGMDAVLGLAMTHTGVLYPIFGTLIGWLGVALTGTDAGSNALFGSLQVITANKLGLSPVLMAAANTAGGVMGKMISAQSIIVACVATGNEGKEGDLFRAVWIHGVVLALLVGLVVTFFAYVAPQLIPSGHKYW